MLSDKHWVITLWDTLYIRSNTHLYISTKLKALKTIMNLIISRVINLDSY